MEFLEEEQKVIRRYLLGALDEEQYQQFEERILTSPAFKTQVLIMEDELAEDYVAGTLSANDREAFRRRLLLTREQNRRLAFIRALSAYAAQQPPLPIAAAANDARARRPGGVKLPAFLVSRPFQTMLAVVVVLAAGGAFWLLRYSSKSPNLDDLIRRQEIEREVSRLNPPGDQPLPPELMGPAAHISSVTLKPNPVSRSAGELAKVEVLNNVTIVQFRLKLPLDRYDSYLVALYTSKGLELLRHHGLTPQTMDGFKDLMFNMPSSALPPGDYQLKLSGHRYTNQFEEVADYYFRVTQ